MSAPILVHLQRIGPVAVPLPEYQSEGAAGFDLCAALESPIVLQPGKRHLIPTGLRFQIPAGYEGQIRARSGLALKFGIGIVNAPGTIDSDFRGGVAVVLINHGDEPFTVAPLARIAQMVIAPVARAQLQWVETLSSTSRGDSGYGSTGV